MNKQHPLYKEDLQTILSTKGIEALHGKSLLVTGATGLIGTCLIDALMAMGDVTVIAIGRDSEKAKGRLGEYYDRPTFRFVSQDVCYPLPTDVEPDYIIPAASMTHPMAYSQLPIETIMINTKGAEHALEKALQCGATVLYPSSVEVYGNARGQDTFGEDYTGQLNLATARACYTESKRVSEAMCQSYKSERGVKVKIVRLSRVFGPTMLTSDSKASSQFLLKALRGEDIVLKSEGNQFFSYTYVADAVAAMLHVMLNGEDGAAYNIANKDCDVHLRDFAQMCADFCHKQVVFDLPSETERKGFSVATTAILDNERLLQTGWQPHYTMKDAVRRTLEIMKD